MSSDSSDIGPLEGSGVFDEAATKDWLASNRRNFFKSAALGSAAAAMYSGGTMFAPLAAYGHDLSSLNCTANDVRIPAPAQILNEPCACTGSFDAMVEFPIVNNTGTTRYCVTLHLCPVQLPNGGGTFDPGDVIIGDIPAKFEGTKTALIRGYPCGSGLLCFGAAGPEEDGGFPKGAACPEGECCTTISWNVNEGAECGEGARVISSKCRHQQICIQGRGSATLDCGAAAGVQTSCPVDCGGMGTLRACTSNAAGLGPFTYSLTAPGVTPQNFGPTTDTCHDFTVGPITATKVFTVTITDNDGCAKTAQATLTVAPQTVSLNATGGGSCNSGQLTFTATPLTAGCTYLFTVDGATVQNLPVDNATRNVYVYPADPDGDCHTVSVVKTCNAGACPSSPDSIRVRQCVTSTIADGACPFP